MPQTFVKSSPNTGGRAIPPQKKYNEKLLRGSCECTSIRRCYGRRHVRFFRPLRVLAELVGVVDVVDSITGDLSRVTFRNCGIRAGAVQYLHLEVSGLG